MIKLIKYLINISDSTSVNTSTLWVWRVPYWASARSEVVWTPSNNSFDATSWRSVGRPDCHGLSEDVHLPELFVVVRGRSVVHSRRRQHARLTAFVTAATLANRPRRQTHGSESIEGTFHGGTTTATVNERRNAIIERLFPSYISLTHSACENHPDNQPPEPSLRFNLLGEGLRGSSQYAERTGLLVYC